MINNELKLSGISSYRDVTLGGDICEGKRYLIFIKEDATIASLSIDSLSCASTIVLKGNVGNLTNVSNVYASLRSEADEYEPQFYNIYATTNGQDIVINDYLN